MTDFYASLVAGISTLAGSLGTLWLKQHEDVQLRRLDYKHDHIERLQDRRFETYSAFDGALQRYRKVIERLHINDVASRLAQRHSYQNSDRERSELNDAIRKSLQAVESLEEALDAVQLVATSDVVIASIALNEALDQERRIETSLISAENLESLKDDGKWEKLLEAKAATEIALLNFKQARRRELGLDISTADINDL